MISSKYLFQNAVHNAYIAVNSFFEVSPKWRFFGLRKTMEHTDQRD